MRSRLELFSVIQAYRHRGHTNAKLDPLEISEAISSEDLNLIIMAYHREI